MQVGTLIVWKASGFELLSTSTQGSDDPPDHSDVQTAIRCDWAEIFRMTAFWQWSQSNTLALSLLFVDKREGNRQKV